MKFLEQLDQALLRLCTRISHTVQILTGITNFFIAKIGVLISTLSLTMKIVNYFYRFLRYPTGGFILFLDVILMVIAFSRVRYLDKADEQHRMSEERVNYNFSSFWSRMIMLFFVLLDGPFAGMSRMTFIDEVQYRAFAIGLLIFYYFAEVTPLPPRKSKIRQLIERAKIGSQQAVAVGARS